jgi:ATP-dependent DNA ligase
MTGRRLAAIAPTADRIKAKSFTIDGEAVVLGPDGSSQFEESSRQEAARNAILYALRAWRRLWIPPST